MDTHEPETCAPATLRARTPEGGPRLPPPIPTVRPPRGAPARYARGELLGRGGMGAVHACEDRRLSRTVAMKVLARGADDGARVAAFVDEARLQGRLEHPAIVPVYDLGTTENGTPFFTMKCVRGVTLAQVLEARRTGGGGRRLREWTDRRLFTAFVTVCLAVEYAHRCGVVHGDLKPENVMLGRFGEVHVLDWGCAARARPATPEDPRTVETCATADVGVLLGLLERGVRGVEILGTPGYLAPEEANGQRGDQRSDVYALGAILFEIVTGQRLHDRPTALARLVSTLEAPVHRPSERAPALAIPAELDALVVAALAREPEARPAARDLAAGVERWLDGELAHTGALRAAEKHAREAALAADRAAAPAGDERDRESALREAGRALALDPGNAEAIDALARVLRMPRGTALPAAVRAECAAAHDGLARASIDSMRVRALVWMAMIPAAAAMGVRSWTGTLVAIAVVLACALGLSRLCRAVTVDRRVRLGALALATAGVASITALFGPLVLAPTFAATMATIFGVGLGRQERRLAGAASVAAVVLPLLLELVGILPPSIAFEPGRIILLPRLVDFAPSATAAFLTAGSLLAIVVPMGLGARLRDAVDERIEALAHAEWQLRRALPSSVSLRLP